MSPREIAEWYILIGLAGGFAFFIFALSCGFDMFCDWAIKRADNKVAQAVYSYEFRRTGSEKAGLDMVKAIHPGMTIRFDGEVVA